MGRSLPTGHDMIATGATLDHFTTDIPPADAATSALSTWILVGQVASNEPLRTIAVTSSKIRVGRRPDCELYIPNMGISSAHAEITPVAGGLEICDLGSTNGTFVNGVQIAEPTTLKQGDIVQFSSVAFRVQREVCADSRTNLSSDSDAALALIQFDKLVSDRAVIPYFQPIVRLDSAETIGYEVLARSRLYGLTYPDEMFRAATRLDLAAELSRIARLVGVRIGSQFSGANVLYLNTHPTELNEAGLIDSLVETRAEHPDQPIVLEIHEAAVTNSASMGKLRASLTDLGIQLAYDDFGAGQARLHELVEVPPDVLKFDMQLVRGIDQAHKSRQQVIAALVDMAVDLGIQPLAEGVETETEAEMCRELGFELAQGYFFGRPISMGNVTDEKST